MQHNGVSVFGALWTCMTSRYIHAQVLAFTKSHKERLGPLERVRDSALRYGFKDPKVIYSDDPVKVKHILIEVSIIDWSIG